jgi:predicted outer membrane repeat protein
MTLSGLDRSGKLDGDGRGTVLTIQAGVSVDLNALTVTGGGPVTATGNPGGGIYNSGKLTLDNTGVSGTTAGFNGGGIFNYQHATLTLDGRTSVSHNTAQASGGGIWNSSNATLTVRGSASVSHNNARVDGGGGIYTNGTLAVGGDASVSDNASSWGGGIAIDAGTATLGGLASVSGNTSVNYDGGGIWNNPGVTLCYNTAPGAIGGGIDNGGTLTGAVAGSGGNVFGNEPDDIN